VNTYEALDRVKAQGDGSEQKEKKKSEERVPSDCM
jgi:hypothetical protein